MSPAAVAVSPSVRSQLTRLPTCDSSIITARAGEEEKVRIRFGCALLTLKLTLLLLPSLTISR